MFRTSSCGCHVLLRCCQAWPPHVLLLHPAACSCCPMQAAILSPDKKVDREYTPKLADAIRAPSPSGTLQPDGALPPVGDLFALRPALPAYLSQGPASVPRLPEWDSRRPYLTGRFLYDAAVDSKGSSEASRPPALDTYPAGVQESLREWHVLWVAVNWSSWLPWYCAWSGPGALCTLLLPARLLLPPA